MRRIALSMLVAALAIMHTETCIGDDAQITQQIASKLRAKKATKELKGFHIGLKVEEGRVWMKGQVANAQQQSLALDIARRIPGVKLVVNELSLKAESAITVAPTITAQAALAQPTSTQLATETVPAQAQLPLAIGADKSLVSTAPAITVSPAADAAPSLPSATPQAPTASQYATLTGSGLTNSSIPTLQVSPSGVSALEQTSQSPAAQPQPVAIHAAQAAPRPISQSMILPTASPVAMSEASPIPVSSRYAGGGAAAVSHDHPHMPAYAWPSYAAHPNYGAVTYPKQYSATAWPYIGPFYPYPQVPLGWRKVSLEWDDGWWFLDFKSK